MNKSAVQTLQNIIKVRIATMSDLEELMSMGKDLHKENGLLGFDEDIVREAAIEALTGQNAVVGVIGEKGTPIQGAVHLAFRQFWYTHDWHLEAQWVYVRPEYRRSKNAQILIEFAKDLAIGLKVPLLIGALSNQSTEPKNRLYRRRLGEPAGTYFLFNAKTGSP